MKLNSAPGRCRQRKYSRGAQLIFANAEALYNEAQTLGQAGCFAWAAVLHQISMEEMFEDRYARGRCYFDTDGHDVDEDRIAKAFGRSYVSPAYG